MDITELINEKNSEVICSNLEDFINLVDAYKLQTILSSHQASDLLEQIKDILENMDCTKGRNLLQSLSSLTESIFDFPVLDISSIRE